MFFLLMLCVFSILFFVLYLFIGDSNDAIKNNKTKITTFRIKGSARGATNRLITSSEFEIQKNKVNSIHSRF